MRGGDEPVVVSRIGKLTPIHRHRASEVTLEIVGEPEMVRDIRVQRTDRRVTRVRLTVGLDLVRLALHELRCALEVRDGATKITHREIAMSAVTIEPRIVGVQRDTLRIHVDRFANAPEIRQASSQPDDGLGVRWRAFVGRARLGELSLILSIQRTYGVAPGSARDHHAPRDQRAVLFLC